MQDTTQASRREFVGGSMVLGAGLGIAGLAADAGSAAQAVADEGAGYITAEEYVYGDDGEFAGNLDPDNLRAYLKDHRNYAAAYTGAFLGGEENAPTDEELEEILQIGNSYQWCHTLTGAHFIVVRDPDEQKAMIPQLGGTDTTGTVTVLMLADGCKDQEYHTEKYDSRSDEVQYWQMHLALIELGQAHAYMNLAARALGYRIHNFAALSIDNISYDLGMGDQSASPVWACGGDFDIIRADNWDIEKYCHARDDETKRFKHYVMTNGKEIDVDGNLTLVYACVIGRLDEAEASSNVSDFRVSRNYYGLDQLQDNRKVRYNYSFWDAGIDGLTDSYPQLPAMEE